MASRFPGGLMRRLRPVVLLAALWLWTPAAKALPERTGWVTDASSALSEAQRQELELELDGFSRRTDFEIAVVTVGSLEGRSIEDYSFKLAKTWKVGKAGLDNGVVLLVAPSERKMRIETGKGVGLLLTDLESNDILTKVMRPKLQAGDVAAALREGARAIEQELQGTPTPAVARARDKSPPALSMSCLLWGGGILAALVVIGSLLEARKKRMAAIQGVNERRMAGLHSHQIEVNFANWMAEKFKERFASGDPPASLRQALELSQRLTRKQEKRLEALRGMDDEIIEASEVSAISAVESPLRQALRELEEAGKELEKATKELHSQLEHLGSLDRSQGELQGARDLLARLRSRLESQGALLSEDERARAEQQSARLARLLDPRSHDLVLGQVLPEIRQEVLALLGELDRVEASLQRQERDTRGLRSSVEDLGPLLITAQARRAEVNAQFPGEKLPQLPSLAEVRACLARATSHQGRQTRDSFEAHRKAILEGKEKIQTIHRALKEPDKIHAERKERREQFEALLPSVERLWARCSMTTFLTEQKAICDQGKEKFDQAREMMARFAQVDSTRTLAALREAESLLASALAASRAEPPEKDDSSGGPGWGSDSSLGGSSSAHGGGYDSGYDSGSSGGGDYGGGGSSSDW